MKNTTSGLMALAAVIVAGGFAYYIWAGVFSSNKGEPLPRFTVELVEPEKKNYEVGESFAVDIVVTTVTPKLEEYDGVWNENDPYQRSWLLDGFLASEGVLLVSESDLIVKREEIAAPPEETERGITRHAATVTCEEEGAGSVVFLYTTNVENEISNALEVRGSAYNCIASGDLPPDEFGGGLEAGGAPPKVNAPSLNPGVRVEGLEGLGGN